MTLYVLLLLLTDSGSGLCSSHACFFTVYVTSVKTSSAFKLQISCENVVICGCGAIPQTLAGLVIFRILVIWYRPIYTG